MIAQLNAGYVLGLLTDVERQVASLESLLAEATTRSTAVNAALEETLERYQASRATGLQQQSNKDAAAREIARANSFLAKLHQEIGTLQRRADELRDAMRQSSDEAAQRQLRRNRAQLIVEIEDRQKAQGQWSEAASVERGKLRAAEEALTMSTQIVHTTGKELDELQKQLPSPHLFLQLFESHAGRSHCTFYLDRNRQAWQRDMRVAIGYVAKCHENLRAGRYRLEQHADVLGGRAQSSAEAMYAAIAVGDWQLGRSLFMLIADPNLFFQQIFHVFRVWCLGLFLDERYDELAEMLQLHEYADGIQGVYAQAFLALLRRDAAAFQRALKNLVQTEWSMWWRQSNRALGVVNVNVLALCRLGHHLGMRPAGLGPTVPGELR